MPKKINYKQFKLHKDFLLKRRKIEKEKGMYISKSEIANEIGISRITLHRILHGEVVPDLKSLVKICRWIGKPIDDYLT